MRGRRKSSHKLILFIAVAVIAVIVYFGFVDNNSIYTVAVPNEVLPNMICTFKLYQFYDDVLIGAPDIFVGVPFFDVTNPSNNAIVNEIKIKMTASCNDSFPTTPPDMFGWSIRNIDAGGLSLGFPKLALAVDERGGPAGEFIHRFPITSRTPPSINMIEDVEYDVATWTFTGNQIETVMREHPTTYQAFLRIDVFGTVTFQFVGIGSPQLYIININPGTLTNSPTINIFKPPPPPPIMDCTGCVYSIETIKQALTGKDITNPLTGLDTTGNQGRQIEIVAIARSWSDKTSPYPEMIVKQQGTGITIFPTFTPFFDRFINDGDDAVFRALPTMKINSADGGYVVSMTIEGRTNPFVSQKVFYVSNLICPDGQHKEDGVCVPDDIDPTTVQGTAKFHYVIDFNDGSSIPAIIEPGSIIDISPIFSLVTDLGDSDFKKGIAKIDLSLYLHFENDEELSRFSLTQNTVILDPKMTVEGTEINVIATPFPKNLPVNPECTGTGTSTVCGPPKALLLSRIVMTGPNMFNQIAQVATGDGDVPLTVSATGGFNLLEGAIAQTYPGVTASSFSWNMKYTASGNGPPIPDCVAGTPVPSPPHPPNKLTVCDPQICIDMNPTQTPIAYETGKYYCAELNCPPGEFKDINGVCKPPAVCPEGFELNPDGSQCVPIGGLPNTCPDGLVLIDEVCQIPPSPCPEGEILIDGFCQPNECLLPNPPPGLCGGDEPGAEGCTIIGINLPPTFSPICNLVSDLGLTDEQIYIGFVVFILLIIIIVILRRISRPSLPGY